MAVDLYCSYDHTKEEEEEDDFIDMEVNSYYNFLHHKTSPPHQSEFEFQMQSGPLEQEQLPTTSPADELFYKGKLLPLHLPPRMQMVENLLHNQPSSSSSSCDHKEFFSTPLTTNAAPTPITGTPFQSCNVSPAGSCQVSRELNPEEYFLDCSNEERAFIDGQCHSSKRSNWARRLKLIKQSSLLSSKIKASRAYLKSLFGKSSGGSDELSSSAMAAKNKDQSLSSIKGTKKSPFGEIKPAGGNTGKNEKICHRRSFSGAFKLRSAAKTKMLSSSPSSGSSSSSSSSFSSSNSNGSSDLQPFKRSSSAKSELESSIEGAIAHCKQSNSQVLRSRKTFRDVGIYPSRFAACEKQPKSEELFA